MAKNERFSTATATGLKNLVQPLFAGKVPAKRIWLMSEVPLPFLHALVVKALSRATRYSVQRLFIEDQAAIMQLKVSLATTFLGQSVIYAVHVSPDLSLAHKKTLQQVLVESPTEHIVVVHTDTIDVPALPVLTLEVSQACSLEDKQLLAQLLVAATYDADKERPQALVPLPIFMKLQHISTDQFLMLLNYQSLLPRTNQHDFADKWLPRIMQGQESIFACSTAFFACRHAEFFAEYKQLRLGQTAEQFCAFWLEMVFQAALVVRVHGGQPLERALTKRLPFSFLKTDWRQVNLEQLAWLARELIECERSFKAGGDEGRLSLVLHQWFVRYKRR
jgi:hypothetical protein